MGFKSEQVSNLMAYVHNISSGIKCIESCVYS